MNVGELRGCLSTLEELVKYPRLLDFLVIAITDSRVVLGAMAKGRSPAWSLLRLLRRRLGFCLAPGIRVRLQV